MLPYLVFVGAAVNLFGTSFYIRDTLRARTKPNRVTWFLWALAPLIATAAAISDGVGWAALPVFMAGFTPLLVFLASFWNSRAYWKLERFDYLCGALSLLALGLWAVTKSPSAAIIFAIASDWLAALPTFKKAWKHPETESSLAYICGIFSISTAFFSIQNVTFTAIAFPIFVVIQNSLIIFTVCAPKRWRG